MKSFGPLPPLDTGASLDEAFAWCGKGCPETGVVVRLPLEEALGFPGLPGKGNMASEKRGRMHIRGSNPQQLILPSKS